MADGKPPALVMIPWPSILFADDSLVLTKLSTEGHAGPRGLPGDRHTRGQRETVR